MFREQGAVDELGLGRIRDAFSDRLFPGISVLWRRARYLFFVPWIYVLLERGEGGRGSAEDRARRLQRRLARELMGTEGDGSGVIGASGADVKQPPDAVLWAGLAAWDIRRDHGSLTQVRAEAVSRATRGHMLEDDDDVGHGAWHPRAVQLLPEAFPAAASFDLTPPESAFLRETLEAEDALPGSRAAARADSLLAVLVRDGTPANVTAPWEHPMATASDGLRSAARHAGLFSDLAAGARLLYVDLVARSRDDEDLCAQVDEAFSGWPPAGQDGARFDELCAWVADPEPFWRTLRAINPRISRAEEEFVRQWGELVKADPTGIRESPAAQRLIVEREHRAKGARRARLALDGSIGRDAPAVLPSRLTFRWAEARSVAADIRGEA